MSEWQDRRFSGFVTKSTRISSVVEWISAISDAVSAVGILAAGWWFLETNQRKQRVQFDLDCRFFDWLGRDGSILAEIWFVFENKGFVEHRLYDLLVSVHVDVPLGSLKPDEAPASPWYSVTSRKSIVPKETGFYFVRPGVNQIIRHVVRLPAGTELMRVTASFNYHAGDKYPHAARRIFSVMRSAEHYTLTEQRHNESL